MTLLIDGHSFHYEMENLCRIFYPHSKINIVTVEPSEEEQPAADGVTAYTGLKKREDGSFLLAVRLKTESAEKSSGKLIPAGTPEDEIQRRMAVTLWQMFSDSLGYRPKWGILTGVRPIKLYGRLAAKSGEEAASQYFREKLYVAPEIGRASCRERV